MHTCTYCISVDGQKRSKRIKMKAMKENIAGVCLQRAHRVQLMSQHAILLFLNILVNSQKHIKTVGWT